MNFSLVMLLSLSPSLILLHLLHRAVISPDSSYRVGVMDPEDNLEDFMFTGHDKSLRLDLSSLRPKPKAAVMQVALHHGTNRRSSALLLQEVSALKRNISKSASRSTRNRTGEMPRCAPGAYHHKTITTHGTDVWKITTLCNWNMDTHAAW